METIKVHQGLASITRKGHYHMGHYAVDMQDGELRFELIAQVCSQKNCLCSELQIDWVTEGTTFATWLREDGSWQDGKHGTPHEDMLAVFQNIQDTDLFKERYERMLFLRHRMILEEMGRDGETFHYMVLPSLLMPGSDLSKGIFGRVQLSSKLGRVGFTLVTCGKPECYCYQLLFILEDGRLIAHISPEDEWSPPENCEPEIVRLMNRARASLGKDPRFRKLCLHFRQERRLENYHRHVFANRSALTS